MRLSANRQGNTCAGRSLIRPTVRIL
ncbi:TPA: hypothetical protein ACI7BJ_004088 [Escherichia coli]|nr:hypothetical protein [Escherichia coli]MDA6646756.1 hypothetical protein [Escherichia coli]MDF4152407.1 hypothetical protein [Escherichia coli]